MPEGTVFCKIRDNECFISEPQVKDGPLSNVDFCKTGISDFMIGDDSKDFWRAIMCMQKDPTMECEMELWGGRDGLYEGDDVKFIIFSKNEVQQMIDLLQEALENGYKD